MKTYFIKDNYIPRINNQDFDDTTFTDEWQKEVYQFAETVAIKNNFQKILDIGTGSGYKLLKHFDNYITLGIDVSSTVDYLNKKYPTKQWTDKFEPVTGFELIICSDVIEHIPDPDILLDLIIECQPKLIVLSTPERVKRYHGEHNGPPLNPCHVREWNMKEFHDYISSKLEVIQHFYSSNHQSTQTMLCKLKSV